MVLGFITRVEEVDGHDCSLDPGRVADDVLVEAYGAKNPTGIQQLLHRIRRSILVSRKHPYTKYVFKSTRAYSREVIRHAAVDITTIHPFSEFRSDWEIFMVVVHLIGFLCYPFVIAFISHEGKGFEGCMVWNKVILSICIIIIFDIVVNFRTGYVAHKSKEIVLTKRRIARRYVCSYFFFDVISAFPYDFLLINHIALSLEYHWLMYLHLIKIVRIGTLYSYSKQMLERLETSYVVGRVVITTFMMILFLHWVSCMYTVRHVERIPTPAFSPLTGVWNEPLGSLFRNQSYDSLSLSQRWRLNFAIAVSNVIGCNMGFIGRTKQELATYIVVIWLSLFFLIYIAVQVIIITRIMNDSTARYERMQCQLKEYIKYKHIPPVLERRLIEYFKFSHVKTYLKESMIFQFLSSRLKQEVLLHSCNQLIDQMPFFRDMSPGVIAKLVASLTPEVVLANDVVMKAGMPGDTMYIISSGSVAVFSTSGKEVCHLTDGAHFGEIALMRDDDLRVASIVAVESSELYALTRADFLHALAPHPELLERVRETAEKRISIIRELERKEESRDMKGRTAKRFLHAGGLKGSIPPIRGLSVSQVTGKNKQRPSQRPQLFKQRKSKAASTANETAEAPKRKLWGRTGPLSLLSPPPLRAKPTSRVPPPPSTRSDRPETQEPQLRYVHPMPASLGVTSQLLSSHEDMPSTSRDVAQLLAEQSAIPRPDIQVPRPSSYDLDTVSEASVPLERSTVF